jgi:hypothetical protein
MIENSSIDGFCCSFGKREEYLAKKALVIPEKFKHECFSKKCFDNRDLSFFNTLF